MKRIILFLLFAVSIALKSQIPVGAWRTHLTYNTVTLVAEAAEKVYCASNGSLFSYNKTDQSLEVYSKLDGLSDNNITLLSYNSDNKVLIIVYDNSNIDLLTDAGKIINIPDIKNKNIASGKTINEVNFFGNNAYLSTAYGISIISLIKNEILDSYLFNKKTFSSAILNGSIYAATDGGILSASLNSNLIDPSQWKLSNSTLSNSLVVFQNNLLCIKSSDGILYQINGNLTQQISSNGGYKDMFVANNTLVVYGQNILSYFSDILTSKDVAGNNFFGISSLNPNATTWHATSLGLDKIDKIGSDYQKIALNLKPEGPMENSPFRMRFFGEKLYIVGGSAWLNNNNVPGRIMFFENEKWTFQKVDTINSDGIAPRDFIDIRVDPRDRSHYFVTSYGEGVYEFRGDKMIKRHTNLNSGIEKVNVAGIPSTHFDRTYGLSYDNDNNLLITNVATNSIIKVYTKDNRWISLFYSPIANKETLFEVIQAKNGLYWSYIAAKTPGLFVFDTKNTLSNVNDDKYRFFSTFDYLENGEPRSITPSNVLCICEDKNGSIWVGTDKGPVAFDNLTKIFDNNYTCTRIKVPRNDGTLLADYLLENVRINAIIVDGANRKWIGTEADGVYLVSENGQQTIHHFTANNSPLISNKILSIAIHPTTGEVFIGTDKGLVSYRSDATEGKKYYSEAYAFPNPVRPDYEGMISITGLKAESTVRITDINGNSVFEGQSVGGQIAWNAKNRSGERVSTGVYLVYASDKTSTEGIVTKIMIVK